jgi:hypothetical protein
MPRGVGHTFSNAGPDPVHVLVVAVPGGLEEMFAEQAEYFASLQGPPDLAVLEDIGARHGGTTLGPPIRADGAPETDRPARSGVSSAYACRSEQRQAACRHARRRSR